MTTPTTKQPLRDCYRLTSIVAAKGSADTLDTQELLRLADWILAPVDPLTRQTWAESVAVPLITELGVRLQRTIDAQSIDMPQLLGRVRQLRSAQRKYNTAKPADRREQAERVAALEAEIDELLAAELQPSLFDDC